MKSLKLYIFSFCTMILFGCGQISRDCAKYTGYDKVCVDGVSYVQFTSGATVQYDVNGKVVTCR